MRYSESPIRALLEMREGRILRSQPRLWLFHLLALTPAYAVTTALRPLLDDSALALYLGFGLVGSLSWALMWLSLQQGTLMPFRQSGSLEELRSAPFCWRDFADGLACHALRRTLGSVSFLLVPLFVALPWVSLEFRLACLGVLIRVLFLLLVGVPLASYLGLCLVAWSHGPRREFGQLALLLVIMPVAGGLGLLLHLDERLGSGRILLVASVLLGGSLLARGLALVGLDRGHELTRAGRLWWDSLVRSARRGASGWRFFTQNPVALRELDRESASVPGGALSQAIWTYGPFLMLQAGLLFCLRPATPTDSNLLYLALLGLVVLGTGLRACSRSQRAIAQDFQSSNLAAWRQTRLTTREVVDGVALAAWLPRSAEALLLVLGTLPVAVLLGVSPELALPAACLTVLAPVCLAYTGVASALEGSLGQLAILTQLCTWFSLVAVYSAAITALRTWVELEAGGSLALSTGCLGLWLVVVSLPYILDTRLRALRHLQG